MKKILTGLSLCFVCSPLFHQEVSAISLVGVSEWAKPYVYSGISNHLVPDSFQNNYTAPITRGEFCALAVATYEEITGSEITERKSFSDTTDENIEKMAGLAVVTGVTETEFSPDSTITREQAAIILSNLSAQLGMELEASDVDFDDYETISSWAVDAVGKVNRADIMGGTEGDTFSPKGNYTKEQSILTLLKVFSMATENDITVLITQAEEKIALMPVQQFYTPSIDGSGLEYEVIDILPALGENSAQTLTETISHINKVLYVAINEFQELDETDFLVESTLISMSYENGDSPIPDTIAAGTNLVDSLLPIYLSIGNTSTNKLTLQYEVKDKNGEIITIDIVATVDFDRDGNQITNELAISSFDVNFLSKNKSYRFTAKQMLLFSAIYEIIDGIEQEKYYMFFGNKMVDPNAVQEAKPQTTPTPEPEPEPTVKAKYRLDTLSPQLKADVLLLRGLGLDPFDTDNYSGTVTVEPPNAILYIADSSILFHSGYRSSAFWMAVTQNEWQLPIFLSSDNLPYFYQTGNYDYVYILTADGFVKVIN